MSLTATGNFRGETWEETPYDEAEGARLTRTSLTKKFWGELDGASTGEMLMAKGQVETSAAYVGFERFTGRVHDRTGTFVLRHSARATAAGREAQIDILPDSGTGELRGIRGTGRVLDAADGSHPFVLTYDFAGAAPDGPDGADG
ncbi:DUF3224 domain-containing protein [Streptomyces sp. NPDC058000]|uniref:DUF3224 domain-containing protein n=1 Tax=Streptomyces sp. NPDC058000 TaxID=3346299 RepID=UPI0036E00633